jgi:hypothetical protein
VPRVLENKKWLIKEYLLALPVLNIVFEEVFITITSVPLKAHKTAESIFHDKLLYMTGIYMSRLFCGREREILYA